MLPMRDMKEIGILAMAKARAEAKGALRRLALSGDGSEAAGIPALDVRMALDAVGTTAAHLAARAGCCAGLRTLHSMGGAEAVGAACTAGRTPLHTAVLSGHHEAVGVLLAAGVEVGVADRTGHTVLHLAAHLAPPDAGAMLRLLLMRCGPGEAAAMLAVRADGGTALHALAARGDEAAIRVVLEAAGDGAPRLLRAADACGRTAVAQATRHGRVEAVRVLAGWPGGGEGVRARDGGEGGGGFSALTWALALRSEREQLPIVRALLQAGAAPDCAEVECDMSREADPVGAMLFDRLLGPNFPLGPLL